MKPERAEELKENAGKELKEIRSLQDALKEALKLFMKFRFKTDAKRTLKDVKDDLQSHWDMLEVDARCAFEDYEGVVLGFYVDEEGEPEEEGDEL